MSLHDNLAHKAFVMGKHSSEFNAAAQKKANGFWMWLVMSAIVWYFFEWQWALIPGVSAVYSALQSISSTLIATRLEKMEAPIARDDPEDS